VSKGESFYPKEENLGRNCDFWNLTAPLVGCNFPKAEMEGRTSCEGVVDDVCLFLKNGRRPASLTEEQRREIKTRVPGFTSNRTLPPGDVK
jgi:hypothetical protein